MICQSALILLFSSGTWFFSLWTWLNEVKCHCQHLCFLFLFPLSRQTGRHSVQQLPEAPLWPLRRFYRRLPLPTGGDRGGDGGASERQEVRSVQDIRGSSVQTNVFINASSVTKMSSSVIHSVLWSVIRRLTENMRRLSEYLCLIASNKENKLPPQ